MTLPSFFIKEIEVTRYAFNKPTFDELLLGNLLILAK